MLSHAEPCQAAPACPSLIWPHPGGPHVPPREQRSPYMSQDVTSVSLTCHKSHEYQSLEHAENSTSTASHVPMQFRHKYKSCGNSETVLLIKNDNSGLKLQYHIHEASNQTVLRVRLDHLLETLQATFYVPDRITTPAESAMKLKSSYIMKIWDPTSTRL